MHIYTYTLVGLKVDQMDCRQSHKVLTKTDMIGHFKADHNGFLMHRHERQHWFYTYLFTWTPPHIYTPSSSSYFPVFLNGRFLLSLFVSSSLIVVLSCPLVRPWVSSICPGLFLPSRWCLCGLHPFSPPTSFSASFCTSNLPPLHLFGGCA